MVQKALAFEQHPFAYPKHQRVVYLPTSALIDQPNDAECIDKYGCGSKNVYGSFRGEPYWIDQSIQLYLDQSG